MLRPETKARARALQILYSWEIGGAPPVAEVATGLARLTGPDPLVFDRAEELAAAVISQRETLDRHATAAVENWRLERMAVIERNILRLGVLELMDENTPPKVAIDEAVQLAHWFGGARAPGFVNGVLDRVAHSLGRL